MSRSFIRVSYVISLSRLVANTSLFRILTGMAFVLFSPFPPGHTHWQPVSQHFGVASALGARDTHRHHHHLPLQTESLDCLAISV